ncbi:MAG: biotin biosynthesis protein BioC [Verrucomicrobia bacterium]|nr:biotin biosynthesis protein BioC [Verrucomicrobiota bacterium]
MVSAGAENEYFEIGQKALQLIILAGQLCNKPHFTNILDLGCGFGRVLRWTRAHYDYAKITACDLDPAAVDFCQEQFGALGAYSRPDLGDVTFPALFDLVWCGSLLTHLPLAACAVAIDRMAEWTTEDGVIVFSTQGRHFGTLLARGHASFAENVDVNKLLAAFRSNGEAFEPYIEDATRSYGLTLASPATMGSRLQKYPNLILRAYLEHAWGVQDIVILYKKRGYFEPLL